MGKKEAAAALDRLERKAEMLRLEAKQRDRHNMTQHMEEMLSLIQIIKRNQDA